MRLYGLAYGHHVRLGNLSQIPLLNPDADPRVTSGEEDHRVESGGLERRRQEECRIEAGRQAFLRNPGRTPDPASDPLSRRTPAAQRSSGGAPSRPTRSRRPACKPVADPRTDTHPWSHRAPQLPEGPRHL